MKNIDHILVWLLIHGSCKYAKGSMVYDNLQELVDNGFVINEVYDNPVGTFIGIIHITDFGREMGDLVKKI